MEFCSVEFSAIEVSRMSVMRIHRSLCATSVDAKPGSHDAAARQLIHQASVAVRRTSSRDT